MMPSARPPVYTVLTATFNRAHTLHRVFESLQKQTFREFEWVLIDDGSNDGTTELVEEWKAKASFPLVYVRQENRGKHFAINRGVALAKGALITVLDSDDACIPEALERMLQVWDTIPEDKRDAFSGVTGLCMDAEGAIVGNKFPFEPLDATPAEVMFVHKVDGEKWGAIRSDVMRQFPFPEINDTPFVPEGIVWDEIGRHFKTRFVNQAWRTYFQDESTGSDQLTRATNFPRIAPGMVVSLSTMLAGQMQWFSHAPSRFCRAAVNLVRFTLHTGRSLSGQFFRFRDNRARLLMLCMLPVGYFAYWRDCWKQNPAPKAATVC
jgi:glycosyltransferase involved in cell wall biosynthesis